MYLGWIRACTQLIQTYMRAASAANAVASLCPMRCHMNQITQPQLSTSGIDQKAISDSLKLDTRFVAISEIEIRMKKARAKPTKGKYHVTSSRHALSTT